MDHLYFVVHTHWDREWYQPFQRMRARLVAMTDRMLGLVESGALPFFHFDGQTIVLDDYLEVRPDSARRIAKLVEQGKIQIGPWYVLADSFLVSGEALIRNLEIGNAIARRFGKPLEIGYLPDQFGHIAQMPQILSGFGLKSAVVWRGVGREINRSRFVWEALDGSAVTTIYLPLGYSNGANIPLDSVDALLTRASEIANREREFASGAPILVMNGSDHTEPDPRIVPRLAEARGRAAMSFELGTLEGFLQRLSEPATGGTPRYRGELRSPARAHMLPGVTSARTWIKQRDFQNCYLLERIADPLVALARLKGRGAELEAFLDMAWRIEIQNHPHDSICGCSIDQVHQDMRYRFDQAAMIAENVVRDAARVLLESGAGEPALAVFNPGFARRALVTGAAEIEDLDARYAAIGPDGRRIAAAVDGTGGERVFDAEITARDFKALVAGLSSAEVMGEFVNRFELRRAGERLELDLYLSHSAVSDLDVADFKRRIAEEVPDDASIRIRAMTAARAEVSFVAEDLTQAGFSFYRIVCEGAAPAEPPAAGGESIENQYYRLTPSRRGIAIEDLESGKRMELGFEDDGDRGDEYNFDPVPGAAAIAEPVSIGASVLERGAARSRLAVSMVYRVPDALAPDRGSRSGYAIEIPVQMVAALYERLERVDFEVKIDNRARDHRFRAALSTPIPATESVSDTSFGFIRRPLAPTEPPGTEDIYPTAPHRTMTGAESAELSAALVSRGLYEAEVRPDAAGATILLTLLRCVGWLSRSDLATRRDGAGPEIETPGAQEPGSHGFEFALTTWRGPYTEADVVQRAQAYAFPPRVFGARHDGATAAAALCSSDNPRIVFSTARPLRNGDGCAVRVFNASPEPETARLTFDAGCKVRLVDLGGRAEKGVRLRRRRDGSATVALRPFQILTIRIRAARS